MKGPNLNLSILHPYSFVMILAIPLAYCYSLLVTTCSLGNHHSHRWNIELDIGQMES